MAGVIRDVDIHGVNIPGIFIAEGNGCSFRVGNLRYREVPAVMVGSGADVSVGGGGVGVKTAAVNVNCDTTVLAAEVRTAATSGVGSGVVEGPQAAMNKAK